MNDALFYFAAGHPACLKLEKEKTKINSQFCPDPIRIWKLWPKPAQVNRNKRVRVEVHLIWFRSF
jgi:hypothetical protein